MKVEFLDMNSDDIKNESILTAWNVDLETKKKALLKKRFYINCNEESALHNWLRYLCKLNNIECTFPVHSELADAIVMCGASKFLWWLA